MGSVINTALTTGYNKESKKNYILFSSDRTVDDAYDFCIDDYDYIKALGRSDNDYMQVGDIAWKLSEEGEPDLVMMISKSYNDIYVAPLFDGHLYLLGKNEVTIGYLVLSK